MFVVHTLDRNGKPNAVSLFVPQFVDSSSTCIRFFFLLSSSLHAFFLCRAHKPPVLWAQRKDRVLLSIYVNDIHNEKIDLDGRTFRFRCNTEIIV